MARRELAALLLAFQFLTRLPVPGAWSPAAMAAAPRWFPAVGALLGAFGAAVILAATPLFGPLVAVLLALGWLALITGGLHEDGLADMADGLGGGGTRDRALEIMRDSRIGSYGALTLLFTVALTAATLAAMPTAGLAATALLLAQSASRFSAVLAMATSAYQRSEGAGAATARPIGPLPLTFAAITGLAPALLLPLHLWAGALIGLAAAHIGTRALYQRRLGGYTGDCLGALQQISQLGLLLGVLAWS
ncbi:adenosylcobinamide-GDP ribazoletransferase [Algicella marina]|uniref:adenosylcobinamide-GDP ribazoletransferase n=1 Tax=Algicella marina TaxID=2683284 RepID=UPI0024DF7731|nr:adenosylcobinamide-GDP ribazoletransferase [Algicella marina]